MANRISGTVLALACLGCAAWQSDPASSRRHIAPAGMQSAYHRYGYTPVIRVGDTVVVSGIPAAGGGDYEQRVRWMYEQLRRHLEAAGASLADVVELTSYHVGARDTHAFQQEFARYLPIHREYFPDRPPAWTAVGTSALLSAGAPVELRALAIVGSGRAPAVEIAPASEP